MAEEEKKVEQIEETPADVTTALVANTKNLNEESLEIINQIIAENDVNKAKDLTYLFNINQNKKTIVRVNKLSDLLDVITEQAITRFSERPDEISNKELLDGLKVVQDIIERGQKQVSGATEVAPLIQINQQDNSVNVKDGQTNLSRESRERVKNAVMDILHGIATGQDTTIIDSSEEEVVDANYTSKEEDK